MKILFHIDEESKWQEVLGNVKNVIKEGNEHGESYIIEVAANGNAVTALNEKAAVNLNLLVDLAELSKTGVVFAACNNSLNKFAMNKSDILPFIQVVPAGVVEIAKKQDQGYSYIKP